MIETSPTITKPLPKKKVETTEDKTKKVLSLIKQISRDAEDTKSLLAIGELLVATLSVQGKIEDLGTLGVKCVLRLQTTIKPGK